MWFCILWSKICLWKKNVININSHKNHGLKRRLQIIKNDYWIKYINTIINNMENKINNKNTKEK